MSAGQDICVRVKGLKKWFHDHTVLDGVDLEVPRGSSLALIGPSACGKTVLLKCLLGLHHIDGGGD